MSLITCLMLEGVLGQRIQSDISVLGSKGVQVKHQGSVLAIPEVFINVDYDVICSQLWKWWERFLILLCGWCLPLPPLPVNSCFVCAFHVCPSCVPTMCARRVCVPPGPDALSTTAWSLPSLPSSQGHLCVLASLYRRSSEFEGGNQTARIPVPNRHDWESSSLGKGLWF